VISRYKVLPALALAAVSAFAQAPAKYAVINIQGALVTTKDGQKAAGELESKAGPRRKELEGKQNEINSLKEQLQKGSNTLSEQAKQDLYRKVEGKTTSLKRDVEDAEADWNQEQQKVLQQLGQKMMAVIDKYAKDNGYALILDVSSPQTPVLYASNTIDITKDIIELYDKGNGGAAAAPGPPPAAAKPAPTPAKPAPATPAKPAPSK
jgi:outer membrane protein